MDEHPNKVLIDNAKKEIATLTEAYASIKTTYWPEEYSIDFVSDQVVSLAYTISACVGRLTRSERYHKSIAQRLQKNCSETEQLCKECPCKSCESFKKRKKRAALSKEFAFTMYDLTLQKHGVYIGMLRRYLQMEELLTQPDSTLPGGIPF